MKALVAGWFSFKYGSATAGDLIVRDVVCSWLDEEDVAYDIAADPPFKGGIDWRTVDPDEYSHLVFVCGPFRRGEYERSLLGRFWKSHLIGLSLTMQVPIEEWNPFDLLIERDSSAGAHPDIAFLSTQPRVPVVGLCLVEDYPEGATDLANAAIHRLVAARNLAAVPIDTRLDTNTTGLRSAAEVESLLARMDVVITTRLHGTVLALRNGVPAIAIDPEIGGAKILRQTRLLGWPVAFEIGSVSDEALQQAFDYCLTEQARVRARECAEAATIAVRKMGATFRSAISDGASLDARTRARLEADARGRTLLADVAASRASTERAREAAGDGWLRALLTKLPFSR